VSLKISKTITLAAVAAAIAIGSAAVPGVSTPAEAKKIIFVKKHFHGFYRPYAYVGTGLLLAGGGYYGYSSYYGSCHWLKVRAIRTGSDYWWDRYHACRGD
jgi:hypothetical protein